MMPSPLMDALIEPADWPGLPDIEQAEQRESYYRPQPASRRIRRESGGMFDIFLRRRTEAESYGLPLKIPRKSLSKMLEAGGLSVLTDGEWETDGENARG